ncbi:ABC transporter permease [Sporolactobacillus shoreicorticis]|uniref:Oligopeptide ABC transporter permease n=1 Tax=Sporolactobacillus shoreicorticis TaxID=1923877 RepID=A0ABW5S5I7_9BACL|nr:oligopeptide ABC transporter permease [Sporolactobacillus shoreicorticis]MCO7126674.1 ABC transporter permease [Sporolactobacillus shoreicorticis]
MLKFLLRRILIMIPQLFILSVLIFTLAKAMPGDALSGQLENAHADPKVIAEQRQKLGLDDPIQVQYIRWINHAIHGDLGMSYTHKIPVTDLIGERLWNTLLLAAATLIVSYAIAIPFGVASGRWTNSWLDKWVTCYTYFTYATPLFIFAILMMFLFSFELNLFPSGGSVDPQAVPGTLNYFISKFTHLVLPTLSGALLATSTTIQFLRNEVIDTKIQDFVATARSKGVPESKVYSRHILRNSFLPIAAFLGYDITGLIGGSVFVESIYSYPGLGQLFLDSIQQRDFTVVSALVMISGFAALLGTLLSDIILSAVDPRIRID